MDPSLWRAPEPVRARAPCARALAKRAVSPDSASSASKKAKVGHEGPWGSTQASHRSSNGSISSKALPGSSGREKFSVLAKIVDYLKRRHQLGETWPISLEDILRETRLVDIGVEQKQWVVSEALPNNPKVERVEGKYVFKPKHALKDKKALLSLLRSQQQQGLEGILLEDIEEGLPRSHRAIQALGDRILLVSHPDKKKIVFFNEKSCELAVEEELQKLWRSVPVEALDEDKIEEYLKGRGLRPCQGAAPKNAFSSQRRQRPSSQRKPRRKTHNQHVAAVLEDYRHAASGTQGMPSL